MKLNMLPNWLVGVVILSCITFGSPFQVSASPMLPADIDSNGKVDIVDFGHISSQWQTDGSAVPSADIAPLPNGDNIVDLLDLILYAQSLLELEPVAVSLTIPDPNAIELSGAPARWIITTSGGYNVTSVDVNISFSAIEAEFFGAASPADYLIRDTGDNPVPNPVTIPVPGSFEVFLHPTNDGIIEPAEQLTMSIDPGEYVVTANDLPANIYDADDSEANNTLLLAYLLPEAAAQTAASGYATLMMNGSNTRGLVSTSFNGLTSVQVTSHLHYAEPSDPQNGDGDIIFGLPLGQYSNEGWDVRATGGFTIGDVIDALYQQNGLNIYLNIHSATYPVGEIRGPFVKVIGSPTFTPPPPPPPYELLTGDDLRRDVLRFLMQATFGHKTTEFVDLYHTILAAPGIDTDPNVRIDVYEDWIDDQFALDQTSLEQLLESLTDFGYDKWLLSGDPEAVPRPNSGKPYYPNYSQANDFVHWDVALQAHDQLRQRMAFALSEIVVISRIGNAVIEKVQPAAEIYWDMLADHADDIYRDVLYDVSKSPLMGTYLSHLGNRKAFLDSGGTLISPDENFAREIQQLFSIGLLALNPDGSLQLDQDGLVIETYSNDDITELARVFTGWGLSKRNNGNNNNDIFYTSKGSNLNNQRWLFPMKNFATYHDTDAKTILGSNISAGLNGEDDLNAALDIIFNHPNVAPFISRRLIQRFTTSNPSHGYLYRVAQAFEDDGLGTRGNLKAVIKAILLDVEVRSLSLVDDPGNNSFGKLKEPILALTQMCRAFNLTLETDVHSIDPNMITIADLVAVGYPLEQADNFPTNWGVIGVKVKDVKDTFRDGTDFDQNFMHADTVFNYYQPDYSSGGDIGAAGLFDPELQIANDSTIPIRYNKFWEILNNEDYNNTNSRRWDWIIDLRQFKDFFDNAVSGGATQLEAAEALVDVIDLKLNAGMLKAKYAAAPTPNPRSIIINTVEAQSNTDIRRGMSLTAPYLVITSPTYQVQR